MSQVLFSLQLLLKFFLQRWYEMVYLRRKGVREMIETLKPVCLFEATKTVDSEFCPDIDRLHDLLLEPFNVPHIIDTEVTIPTCVKFQFLAFHVIKSLHCLVQDEMITQESADAIKTGIEESGAYEIEIQNIYEFKTRVKGCYE